MSQLRMILDTAEFPVAEPVVADGYRLTRRGPEYAEIYCGLRNRAGWGNPDQTPEEFLANQQKFLVDHILPEGLIICEDVATGIPCASATAEVSNYEEYPHLGVLGQVMSDPAVRGKGLGKAVCLAAMRVCVEQRRRYLALLTDDWRTPALKIYLGTGWRPWITEEDMPGRWQKICQDLGYDYSTLKIYTEVPG